MKRRTQKEIEKDVQRIKEAAKTATSVKEIVEMTGLSSRMIDTTLLKHPTILKRVKERLKVNAELQSKIKKEAKKELKKKEEKNVFCGYVIDASITGIENLKEILSKICTTSKKIVLTSVTIKELEKMQKFNDLEGKDARYILALAAENSENFKNVLIDENCDTPDDCIIKYCADNKKKFTLLTSDKTMTLKARMYGVRVEYFKQSYKTNPQPESTGLNVRTLIPAKKVGSQLIISNLNDFPNMSISIFSNGVEYTDGIRVLNVGDDIFIATKKIDYITFAHYRMISTYAEKNCELICSKRFYNYDEINNISKASYKAFLKDFIKLKLNLL